MIHFASKVDHFLPIPLEEEWNLKSLQSHFSPFLQNLLLIHQFSFSLLEIEITLKDFVLFLIVDSSISINIVHENCSVKQNDVLQSGKNDTLTLIMPQQCGKVL